MLPTIVNNDFLSHIELRSALYCTIGVLLWVYLCNQLRKNPRFVKLANQLPGPYALPFVGNSFHLVLAGKDGIIDQQMAYVERYGTVYRLWFCGELRIALSDPEDLKVVFQSKNTINKDGPHSPFLKFWGRDLNIILGAQWRADRKRLEPYFTREAVRPRIPEMNEIIRETVAMLKKEANGNEFNVHKYFLHLAANILTRLEFDHSVSLEETINFDLYSNVENAVVVNSLQLFFPFLNTTTMYRLIDWLLLRHFKMKILTYGRKLVSKKIAKIREEVRQRDRTEFESDRSSFLRSSYELLLESGDDKQMLEEIMTFFIAGTETSAITNSFAVLMLAMHSQIQEKLYQEIYDVFGDDDRPPDYEDLQRLTYLDQVVKETQRRFPVAPTLLRVAENDMKIGSYFIPAGTGIALNTAAVHLNPTLYPNPNEFNPDNFAPEAVKRRPQYSFFPFSGGARNCIASVASVPKSEAIFSSPWTIFWPKLTNYHDTGPGKYFAETESRLALAALVRAFTFHTSVKMEDIKINVGFLAYSANGYYVSFKPRNS